MDRISPRDVSVVLQGPMGEWTAPALRSAHEVLPGCQVILSTWQGTVSPELRELATIIENEDPGGGPTGNGPTGAPHPAMNTNRMLVSTSAGVERAERDFTFKLRSDTPLTTDAALGWRTATADAERSLFSERILACSVATRPSSSNLLYHLSDCVQFGRTEDLRQLWSGSRFDENQNVGYWRRQGRATPWGFDARYANEQVVWTRFLRDHGVPFNYPYLGHPVTPEEAARSTRLFVENFVVLEPWQMGVAFPTLAPVIRASALGSYMFFEDWLSACVACTSEAAAVTSGV